MINIFESLVLIALGFIVVWSIIVHLRLHNLEETVKMIIYVQNLMGKNK